MGLNKDLVGKRYDETTYEVTAEAIEKYARATNDLNDRYLAGDDVIAPPVFPIVPAGVSFAAPLFDPELQVNFLRLVHGGEEHVFHRPLRAGDKLTYAAEVEAIEEKSSGELLVLRADLRGEDGETAVTVRSTMFIRGKGRGGSSSASGPQDAPQRDVVAEDTEKVDQDQTFRYADASGDHNPLHTDDDTAKAAGLPGVILHGMCTMAFAAKGAVDQLAGGDAARVKRVAVRLSKPVFPGQELTTRYWRTGEDNGSQSYGFETVNPDGIAVITDGEITIGA